ncbi:Transmembrane adaptor Erv26 [Popillia japonica]|uniref:Protein TEX261 n=1 Tax=Popillia japonica TaxID=7064 RepID=A0AAW1IV19_POPJA
MAKCFSTDYYNIYSATGLSYAAGLYYLAELVEEYTVFTKKCIWWTNLVILILYLCLWLFEKFPILMTFCGILAQILHFIVLQDFPFVTLTSPAFILSLILITVNLHFIVLQDFPFVTLTSPAFILSLILITVNHYFAFTHFSSVFYSFSEVMAYFTLFLWLVPFSLLISLSANENVLPTTTTDHGRDVVTDYFSKKNKKYGLLTFFNYAKESLLPQRRKKGF